MREQIIGILPFISFEEKIIRLDGFLMFSESRVHEISELSRSVQEALNGLAQNQKAFIQNTYGNQESEVTFLLLTDSHKRLEDFLEILFFYLHKGRKLTNLLLTPNVFCREDFRFFVLRVSDADSPGKFLAKKKFKFHIVEKVEQYIISPIGCENVITQNQQHGYIFKNIKCDHRDETFQCLLESLDNTEKRNLLQGISFYNRALSCEIADPDRFVWLSSSLESFFQIENQNDKAKAIKQRVKKLLRTKAFQVIDKNEVINNVVDLITVVYDYRSSYVHGGKTLTEHTTLKTKLEQKLGKLSFVVALMNLVSFLLMHEKIPDKKLEGVLHVLFYNQECFEYVVKVYKDSADGAISELQNPESILAIYRFLSTAEFQTISFDRQKIEKCLDNILHVLAKFARANQNLGIAKEVQQQINITAFSDKEKFKKWNNFLQNSDISDAPEPVKISALVFQHLFQILQFEYALY